MGDTHPQHNPEAMVTELMHQWEGWREVILYFHPILLWENPWHTAILFSSISYIFLMIWWCDLSLISTFSIAGAVITVADYMGPIVIKTLSDPSQWSIKKEKTYEDICSSLVHMRLSLINAIYWIKDLKGAQPLLYYAAAVLMLMGLAFTGQVINNLLLTYLLVVLIVLLPGMRHNHPLKTCLSFITSLLRKSCGKSSGSKKGKSKGN